MKSPLSVNAGAASRLAIRLAIFAILFQAILFGWHHHSLHFAGGQHQPVAVVSGGAAPTLPGAEEDGCDICLVLHHQTATASQLPAALPPLLTLSVSTASDGHLIARTPALAFRARAPPLA
jgi:hypothetical protein